MKRILTVFPAVICLILSLCVPLAASAGVNVRPGGEIYTYYSLEQFKTKYNYSDESYLYVSSYFPDSDYRTYSLYLQTSADNVSSVEEDNGVYKVSFTDSVALTRIERGYSGFDSGYDYSVYCFKYDSINNTIVFYSGFNFTSEVWIPGDWVVYQVDSNILNSTVLPDVVVKFTPDLSGSVSRNVSVNGNDSKLQSISMYIENRSSFNIQYQMRIYKADQISSRWDYENPDNYSRDNLSTSYDDDPVFIYYSNTQVYSHIKTDSKLPGLGNHKPSSLYTKASYFHKLSAGQSETISFPLSMINLSENVNYRVVVSAYKLDYDYVTEAFVTPGYSDVDKSNYEYDTETLVTAYDSVFNFSDLSGVKYDPNKTSGNILSYNGSNGISDQKRYSVNYDAVTDLKTGETKIGHVDNFNSDSYWESIGVPFQNKHNNFLSDLDSDINISSFSGMFSRVFGGVNMFMNYLPPSIMSVFVFGFSCIVVIAIIKAVR